MKDLTLFTGGRVWTAGFASARRLEVLVKGEYIAAVARPGEVSRKDTTVIDLDGAVLMPGFQDAHIHPGVGGHDLMQCNLLGIEDVDEVISKIVTYSESHPELEWVLGGGWDQHLLHERATAALLDSIVGGRKALLHAHSRHAAWASSAALEAAGIDKHTPNPANGTIDRYPNGEPTGIIHENAVQLVSEVLPQGTTEELAKSVLTAQDYLLSVGVTSIQDAIVGTGLGIQDHHAAYVHLLATEDLHLRVTAALWWDPARGTEQIPELIERRRQLEAAGKSTRMIADTVKMMVDGTNLIFMDRQAIIEAVRALDVQGFTVHFHSYGEASTMHILDAVSEARESNTSSAGRHHVAHLMVIRDEDFERFARLNVTANIQGLWSTSSVPHELILPTQLSCDPERREYAFARLQMSGARLAAGSDWPVTSADPLQAAIAASSRTRRDGSGMIDPLDTLDLESALTAYTAGSAYVNGRGATTGRIARGYLADFALLEKDPFESQTLAAPIQVHQTWIGGIRRG